MAPRVCPWWLGYFLASPVRRWLGQDPAKIVSPYLREGTTVLEPGPGMGFFTIPMAQLVGEKGRVVAVDLQPKMIANLECRAVKAGIAQRIDARVSGADSMALEDIAGQVDFTLAFAVVHEFPDPTRFFAQVAAASKSGAQLLLAEPSGHVNNERFSEELAAAASAGFLLQSRPKISRSLTALFIRQ